MLLEFLPTLEVHRELYSMPRGMERFRAYIARMTGGSGDLALPIAAMNPMGKEHMISAVEAWIACGAEEAAVEAVRETAQRFSHRPDRLRVALGLADDVAGAWTNRWSAGANWDVQSLLDGVLKAVQTVGAIVNVVVQVVAIVA